MRKVISEHKNSALYKTAFIAEEYDRARNTTTMQYQLATVHRSTSNFLNIFVTQLNQYLLGNGVTWKNGTDLGNDFDIRLQKAGKDALVGGVSFGFWNLDHLEEFKVTEFAPLYDEENGALAAGVRFWQIDNSKPLRATLYEMDGYTNYLFSTKYKPSDDWQRIDEGVYMMPKRPYKLKVRESEADGETIYDGENYATFPIVPLWGNPHHQSELVGLREKIDAYDFILNGWEELPRQKKVRPSRQ